MVCREAFFSPVFTMFFRDARRAVAPVEEGNDSVTRSASSVPVTRAIAVAPTREEAYAVRASSSGALATRKPPSTPTHTIAGTAERARRNRSRLARSAASRPGPGAARPTRRPTAKAPAGIATGANANSGTTAKNGRTSTRLDPSF